MSDMLQKWQKGKILNRYSLGLPNKGYEIPRSSSALLLTIFRGINQYLMIYIGLIYLSLILLNKIIPMLSPPNI